MKRNLLSLFLALMVSMLLCTAAYADAIEINYQENFLRWDGVTTEADIGDPTALTAPVVYQSDDSATGFKVTFVYYAPDAERVRLTGEWSFSTPEQSSTFDWANIHPNDWFNGCTIHVDDAKRPYDDMVFNAETGYWTYTMTLPSGAYCYQFYVGGDKDAGVKDVTGAVKTSDPLNLPSDVRGVEAFSQVLVPYDAVKQSLSPDYSLNLDNCEQKGTLLYDEVPSASLGFNNPITVYLPYGYDAQKEGGYRYMFLLHGSAGFESNWSSQGFAANIADNLIAKGETEPIIIVMPNMRDAAGDWLEYDNVGVRGEYFGNIIPYVMDEMIPYIEANYNVSKEVEDRAFTGLSRGGRTSLIMYMNCADQFAHFGVYSSGTEFYNVWDFSDPKLKDAGIFFTFGLYDAASYNTIYPVMEKLSAAGVDYKVQYVWGAHRWHVWRDALQGFLTMEFPD